MKNTKIIAAVVGAAAVVGVGAFAYKNINAKDPKEIVISAFEDAFSSEHTSPIEELFGVSDFAESASKENREGGLTIKLDESSDDSLNAYAGSGLRVTGRNDVTNKKTDFNLGVLYGGMDLVNLNLYYGDETLMMSLPELSSRVFTLDLGDGLEERLKNSPTVGPLLEEQGVDVEALLSYYAEQFEAAQNGETTFDLSALMKRYKEGCKAKENFKEALTVQKAGGSSSYGTGYTVLVSKEAMIDFLRTSSDFFLEDETLKDDFLKQLETSVKMSELMGNSMTDGQAKSAAEMQEETYGQLEEGADQMIEYLDQTLSDVEMTVYVDKKGALTAVDGSTKLVAQTEEPEEFDVSFSLRLESGKYPTQNMSGSLKLAKEESTLELSLDKKGTYDGKNLTSDITFRIASNDIDDAAADASVVYSGSYSSDDGAYDISLAMSSDGAQLFRAAAAGVIDELEKGKSFHASLDTLEFYGVEENKDMTFSGEVYSRPLSGEISALEGETMDMLAADQNEWSSVAMELLFGAIGLAGQLNPQN